MFFFVENTMAAFMRRVERLEKALGISVEEMDEKPVCISTATETVPETPTAEVQEETAPAVMDAEPAEAEGDIQQFVAETEAVYPAEETQLPYDIVIQTIKTAEPAPAVQPEAEETVCEEPVPEIPAQNFRMTGDEHLHTGAVARYEDNIAAIELLFRLEAENRNATSEEQEVLSHYAGWGGTPDAFDAGKQEWHDRYEKLKGLLSEEEYAAARDSVLNAHYTSPVVIRAMYEALLNMGFNGGSILEPSMGVGNFFGCLPDALIADDEVYGKGASLYGVELDSISGRIAKKLYPNARITIDGFENVDYPDFFDVAIGNVPFGNYKVNDRKYNRLGFSIHNYFFAKAVDQVRPGGIIAFITSRYMMDAKNPAVRNYLAERADLLGAVRLPENAFKNAGTDVVSDIIFLQKRDMPTVEHPVWTETELNADGQTMNRYFIEHPEMVVGTVGTKSSAFGDTLTVTLSDEQDFAAMLHDAVMNIDGHYEFAGSPITFDSEPESTQTRPVPADPSVKNFSYTMVGADIYYRENSVMIPADWLKSSQVGRVSGMVGLRNITNALISCELNGGSDAEVRKMQEELTEAYDRFVSDYGYINTRANEQAFQKDSSYFLLCSLENYDEKKKTAEKAAIFSVRTINPQERPVSAESPKDALEISIAECGKVDLDFMARLLGKPGQYEDIIDALQGEMFKDPASEEWQTADEYLSGNVRKKLADAEAAAAGNEQYQVNVQYLQSVLPADIDASEIDIRLGAPWVKPDYITQFVYEVFATPYYLKGEGDYAINIQYDEYSGQWFINGKGRIWYHDVAACETYGTHRINAYEILENTLNLKDVRVYDTEYANGEKRRILNQQETMLAQQKQQAIKDAFQEWLWKDADRRHDLVRTYNDIFNAVRPREYDGSSIKFSGINNSIELRAHQKNAVARIVFGGNTLLAHEVGAGKTYEMAAAAMELKRLGLCHKPLFVVPKHLLLQWASEFMTLYPGASLLVAQKNDFTPANRKKFCARIATGDYDAIIISQSQFEKIPLSYERQTAQLREQIDEITEAIGKAQEESGSGFSVKQMTRVRKNLESKMQKLNSTEHKDDVVTFEQLGVDRMFVDEAHYYKNLYLYTKMSNVAGLSTSEAQKSSDMYMKCRYMDELTGGKGVIFATGTPISNSMTELYTMMRYLQNDELKRLHLSHFDSWAATFGETTTQIELAPEGTGYRAKTRFAKFFNLPELMSLFHEAADIRTADQLKLPVPDAEFKTVVVEPTTIQEELVKDLSERAARIHQHMVDPSEDNMLKITSDGRKIGLDQRMINPDFPDSEGSKINACVSNVYSIWEHGTDRKLTQLIFCDMGTPKKKTEQDGSDSFCVYSDVRTKLVEKGVPETDIAFIHDYDTDKAKSELFEKVRSGNVRILIGSTSKMGSGMNVQDRLIALHHLDVGWKPSDMTQRNGRIIRQGNLNPCVQVYNYVTKGTFDAYLWQMLENKQRFISQIMTSKSPVRSCEDVDEQVLSYAEVKALCAGNPLIKEKMDLEVAVAKLRVLKSDFQSRKFRMEDQKRALPDRIRKQEETIRATIANMQIAADHSYPVCDKDADAFAQVGINLSGQFFTEYKDASDQLVMVKDMCRFDGSTMPVGSYRGFALSMFYDMFQKLYKLKLSANGMSYVFDYSRVAQAVVRRMNKFLDEEMPVRLEKMRQNLSELQRQEASIDVELTKEFPQKQEYAEKSARLAELDLILKLQDEPASDDVQEQAVSA